MFQKAGNGRNETKGRTDMIEEVGNERGEWEKAPAREGGEKKRRRRRRGGNQKTFEETEETKIDRKRRRGGEGATSGRQETKKRRGTGGRRGVVEGMEAPLLMEIEKKEKSRLMKKKRNTCEEGW